MERTLLTSPSTPCFPKMAIRPSHFNVRYARDHNHLHVSKQKTRLISCALPETAASIVVTAVAVAASATLLFRRTKASDNLDNPTKPCEECGGSGICPECKGEGFVLKKLSEESADRARLLAKNMATRYTAGLPKKWSYCTKCSSARSCRTCGGTGQISLSS
ncbi:uncharacterized protein A4U43_C01F7010 [Asparagus officinalis]|uniref:DUF7895 domain-containing protein n=1 Tax=Asparagus officinalis TaxID=4686 RepID=A0A5P1FN07_ASPOF|nr:uncharacterized protein LOC109850510 [Asparagus officinalis]ONK79502.1 uncharacterized protein A4U43_C01F7010 [Asparagus officinalis]